MVSLVCVQEGRFLRRGAHHCLHANAGTLVWCAGHSVLWGQRDLCLQARLGAVRGRRGALLRLWRVARVSASVPFALPSGMPSSSASTSTSSASRSGGPSGSSHRVRRLLRVARICLPRSPKDSPIAETASQYCTAGIYDPWPMVQLINDYGFLCRQRGLTPKKIILTFTPCGERLLPCTTL